MKLHHPWFCLRVAALLGMLTAPALSVDGLPVPMHDQIDRLIDSGRVGPPIALAGDAEFLRRVSIDLTGMPPSSEELASFLTETDVAKRPRAIDRLLASPLHDRQMATILDVMLMERRPSQKVAAEEWQEYLLAACRENRPLNLIFRELLSADGTEASRRPAVRFYLDRGAEPNLITRDVARIFLGRDLQCAQCHDHPLIEDYRQSDYHGLLAFFSPAYEVSRKEADKETSYYAEKAGDDLAFDSVFIKNDKHLTGPRIPGETEMVEPIFPPGEEYQEKAADAIFPVPKFRRRARLASALTDGSNVLFNENIANRLWAMMMGRGLVHPLDLKHPANPPSHPELLKLLASELVALNFDTRAFLREVALSQAYQRTIDLPAELASSAGVIASKLAELKSQSDELSADAVSSQEEYDQAVSAWYSAESNLVPAADEQTQALAKHTELSKKKAEAQKAVDDVLAKIKAGEETAKSLAEAVERTQKVVEKLPNEKDLVAAAQKFADRSKAMSTELAALQKTSTDNAAALEKAIEAESASVKVVESARAKVMPLREAVREKEKVVLAARKKMAESRITLERHQDQLRLLETYDRLIGLEGQAKECRIAIEGRRKTVVRAREKGDEIAKILTQRTEDRKAADQARSANEKVVKEAESALASHQKLEKCIVDAFSATDVARRLVPEDAILAEATQKLQAKADEYRSVSTTLKSRVEIASADLKRSAESLDVAGLRLEESMGESKALNDALAVEEGALTEEESRLKVLESKVGSETDFLATLLGENFQIAQLKPLSPEQMCWSILKVTGVYDRYRQAEEAELAKSKPLSVEDQNDPAKVRARGFEVEDRTYAKLKGNVASFVSVYGAGAGQPQNEFFATADQALFVANAGLVNGWASPSAGNIAERMIQGSDATKTADDLYLTILSRLPTPDESAELIRVLTERSGEKPASVQEWIWGLMSSAEFRFNH
ncbi:DUF1549 domain-containing protein [Tundrisphaera lichenicola]|uniref:DUF1549 domain-containing protein n=1 Tax=Tundrisphaera lichenicola TaxID=2029860 RepID=UPI003EC0E011